MGCFRIEETREKDNGTGLKKGGGIEMSTTVLPYMRCTLSFALYLLTTVGRNKAGKRHGNVLAHCIASSQVVGSLYANAFRLKAR